MGRSLKEYAVLSLKGMAMGAADVVPGVSGGTIAFITGIYEELLDTINAVNLSTLKLLRTDGIKAAWKALNGNFLVFLLLGIAVSFVSLARVVTLLMETQPVLLWSFFFGLVIASVFLVGKQVKKWGLSAIGLVLGTGIAFWITILPPMKDPGADWFLVLSGAIAICAMILPGISGSFILLLLGSYQTVMAAISAANIKTIALFAVGCIVGILSFSRVLKWLFKTYHDFTIMLLTGFLIGSLNKIWPWKITQEVYIKHAGEADEKIVPLVQDNVLPGDFSTLSEVEKTVMGMTDKDPQTLLAIGMAIAGFLLIFLMERYASKSKTA